MSFSVSDAHKAYRGHLNQHVRVVREQTCPPIVSEPVPADSFAALDNQQRACAVKCNAPGFGQTTGNQLSLPSAGDYGVRVSWNQNIGACRLCNNNRRV